MVLRFPVGHSVWLFRTAVFSYDPARHSGR